MRGACIALIVCASSAARADDGFLQGIVAMSKPVSGDAHLYSSDADPRVGVRFGWMSIHLARGEAGLEVDGDWRPMQINGSADEARVMVGPRIAFVAGRREVFFRAVAGYDYLSSPDGHNPDGTAVEGGFGAAYRTDQLRFGIELAIPFMHHRAGYDPSGEFQDGIDLVDVQIACGVAAVF